MTTTQGRPSPFRIAASWAPILVLVALCVIIAAINPAFLSFGNATRIAQASMVPMVLALGATFIVVMGSIDLSVEGGATLAAVILALLVLNNSNGNDYGLLAIALVVATGATLGFLNGVIHVYLRIPSFMTTLGMWFIGAGLANAVIGGLAVRVTDPMIRSLATERFWGFPLGFWLAMACVALAYVFQEYSRFGRYIYALGGGEDLTPLSGISAARVRVVTFTLAGIFYAIGGILAVAQMGQGNAQLASGRLFDTITAVVVGGTSLLGGRGGVLQSVVGVLIVTVLANGMVLTGVPSSMQVGVQGLMIIIAVGLSIDRRASGIVK